MRHTNGYPTEWVDGKNRYVHRRLAGEYRGQKLSPTEVVHHKNEVRSDNSLENLMIMRSENDHILHHNGAETFYDEENMHWYCIPPAKNKCVDCGCVIKKVSVRCVECEGFRSSYKIKLSDMVNSIINKRSFVEAARDIGISDNGLRKKLKKENMPCKARDWIKIKREMSVDIQRLKIDGSGRFKPCGTDAAYLRGCRCRKCLAAHDQFNSERRSKTNYNKEKRRENYLKYGC